MLTVFVPRRNTFAIKMFFVFRVCREHILESMSHILIRNFFYLFFPPKFPHLATNNRYSSVLVSWVKWKNSVMNVWAESCPGCNPGAVVTSHVRNSRNCNPNVSPWKLSNATCANTLNSAPGPGGNCGKRSSLSSTYHALKIKLL